MGSRAAVIAVVLAAGCMAACGHSSPLPRSAANLSVCTTLARVLDGRAAPQALAGQVFESNGPLSLRLRQEAADYVSRAIGAGPLGGRQAAAKAEKDCAAMHAAVARSFGGSG